VTLAIDASAIGRRRKINVQNAEKAKIYALHKLKNLISLSFYF
jgi:hypothetical protein